MVPRNPVPAEKPTKEKLKPMSSVEAKIASKTRIHKIGRGFSKQELTKAGTNIGEALRLHLPVDLRRRTIHEENVQAVKAIIQKTKQSSKPHQKKPKT